MKKLFAFIRILRPINILITFFSIIVAAIICSIHNYPILTVILAGFSGALVAGGGNVINDIFDIEIDKINRPFRAIPSGIIKKSEAFNFYILLNLSAVIIASRINSISLLLVLFSICIVFLYSFKLKRVLLAGNFAVAFMTGLAFIYGGAAVDNIRTAFIPAIFAFLINLIREIIKDIEDLEGDIKNNVFSFPARFGIKSSVRIIYILTITLFIFTFIPFLYKIYKIEYFVIVMLTVNTGLFFFLKKLSGTVTKEIISRGSFLLKLYMIFGLIAIYFGNN